MSPEDEDSVASGKRSTRSSLVAHNRRIWQELSCGKRSTRNSLGARSRLIWQELSCGVPLTQDTSSTASHYPKRKTPKRTSDWQIDPGNCRNLRQYQNQESKCVEPKKSANCSGSNQNASSGGWGKLGKGRLLVVIPSSPSSLPSSVRSKKLKSVQAASEDSNVSQKNMDTKEEKKRGQSPGIQRSGHCGSAPGKRKRQLDELYSEGVHDKGKRINLEVREGGRDKSLTCLLRSGTERESSVSLALCEGEVKGSANPVETGSCKSSHKILSRKRTLRSSKTKTDPDSPNAVKQLLRSDESLDLSSEMNSVAHTLRSRKVKRLASSQKLGTLERKRDRTGSGMKLQSSVKRSLQSCETKKYVHTQESNAEESLVKGTLRFHETKVARDTQKSGTKEHSVEHTLKSHETKAYVEESSGTQKWLSCEIKNEGSIEESSVAESNLKSTLRSCDSKKKADSPNMNVRHTSPASCKSMSCTRNQWSQVEHRPTSEGSFLVSYNEKMEKSKDCKTRCFAGSNEQTYVSSGLGSWVVLEEKSEKNAPVSPSKNDWVVIYSGDDLGISNKAKISSAAGSVTTATSKGKKKMKPKLTKMMRDHTLTVSPATRENSVTPKESEWKTAVIPKGCESDETVTPASCFSWTVTSANCSKAKFSTSTDTWTVTSASSQKSEFVSSSTVTENVTSTNSVISSLSETHTLESESLMPTELTCSTKVMPVTGGSDSVVRDDDLVDSGGDSVIISGVSDSGVIASTNGTLAVTPGISTDTSNAKAKSGTLTTDGKKPKVTPSTERGDVKSSGASGHTLRSRRSTTTRSGGMVMASGAETGDITKFSPQADDRNSSVIPETHALRNKVSPVIPASNEETSVTPQRNGRSIRRSSTLSITSSDPTGTVAAIPSESRESSKTCTPVRTLRSNAAVTLANSEASEATPKTTDKSTTFSQVRTLRSSSLLLTPADGKTKKEITLVPKASGSQTRTAPRSKRTKANPKTSESSATVTSECMLKVTPTKVRVIEVAPVTSNIDTTIIHSHKKKTYMPAVTSATSRNFREIPITSCNMLVTITNPIFTSRNTAADCTVDNNQHELKALESDNKAANQSKIKSRMTARRSKRSTPASGRILRSNKSSAACQTASKIGCVTQEIITETADTDTVFTPILSQQKKESVFTQDGGSCISTVDNRTADCVKAVMAMCNSDTKTTIAASGSRSAISPVKERKDLTITVVGRKKKVVKVKLDDINTSVAEVGTQGSSNQSVDTSHANSNVTEVLPHMDHTPKDQQMKPLLDLVTSSEAAPIAGVDDKPVYTPDCSEFPVTDSISSGMPVHIVAHTDKPAGLSDKLDCNTTVSKGHALERKKCEIALVSSSISESSTPVLSRNTVLPGAQAGCSEDTAEMSQSKKEQETFIETRNIKREDVSENHVEENANPKMSEIKIEDSMCARIEPDIRKGNNKTKHDSCKENSSKTAVTEDFSQRSPGSSDTRTSAKNDITEAKKCDVWRATRSGTTEPRSDTTAQGKSDTIPTKSDPAIPTTSATKAPAERDTTAPGKSDTTEATKSDATEPTRSDTVSRGKSDTSMAESETTITSECGATEPTHSNTTTPAESDTTAPTKCDATTTKTLTAPLLPSKLDTSGVSGAGTEGTVAVISVDSIYNTTENISGLPVLPRATAVISVTPTHTTKCDKLVVAQAPSCRDTAGTPADSSKSVMSHANSIVHPGVTVASSSNRKSNVSCVTSFSTLSAEAVCVTSLSNSEGSDSVIAASSSHARPSSSTLIGGSKQSVTLDSSSGINTARTGPDQTYESNESPVSLPSTVNKVISGSRNPIVVTQSDDNASTVTSASITTTLPPTHSNIVSGNLSSNNTPLTSASSYTKAVTLTDSSATIVSSTDSNTSAVISASSNISCRDMPVATSRGSRSVSDTPLIIEPSTDTPSRTDKSSCTLISSNVLACVSSVFQPRDSTARSDKLLYTPTRSNKSTGTTASSDKPKDYSTIRDKPEGSSVNCDKPHDSSPVIDKPEGSSAICDKPIAESVDEIEGTSARSGRVGQAAASNNKSKDISTNTNKSGDSEAITDKAAVTVEGRNRSASSENQSCTPTGNIIECTKTVGVIDCNKKHQPSVALSTSPTNGKVRENFSGINESPAKTSGNNTLTDSATNKMAAFTPVSGDREIVNPTHGNKPPVTPTNNTQPPVTPADSNKPTVTPTSSNQPPVTPTKRKMATVAADINKPPVTPASSTIPPVTPAGNNKPTVTMTSSRKPTVNPADSNKPTVTPTSSNKSTVTPTSSNKSTVTAANSNRLPATLTNSNKSPVSLPNRNKATLISPSIGKPLFIPRNVFRKLPVKPVNINSSLVKLDNSDKAIVISGKNSEPVVASTGASTNSSGSTVTTSNTVTPANNNRAPVTLTNSSKLTVTPTTNNKTTVTPTNSNKPTSTPTNSSKPTVTPTDGSKPTVTPTNSNKPTITPTNSNKPTVTPTNSNKPTVTPTNSNKPTVTPTNSSKPTVTPTNSSKPTVTPTNSSKPAITPTNSSKPTVTPTTNNKTTVTPTNSSKPTVTPTNSSKPTVTPANSNKPAITPTNSSKPTVTPANSSKPTVTPANSSKPTVTPTKSKKPAVSEVTISKAEETPVCSSKPASTPTNNCQTDTQTTTGEAKGFKPTHVVLLINNQDWNLRTFSFPNVSVIYDSNLHFLNAHRFIKNFKGGSARNLFVMMCGTSSLINYNIDSFCKYSKCSPALKRGNFNFLSPEKVETFLIREAMSLRSRVESTDKRKNAVIFSGLLPTNFHAVDVFRVKQHHVQTGHKAQIQSTSQASSPYLTQCAGVKEFNAWAHKDAASFGLPYWNLERIFEAAAKPVSMDLYYNHVLEENGITLTARCQEQRKAVIKAALNQTFSVSTCQPTMVKPVKAVASLNSQDHELKSSAPKQEGSIKQKQADLTSRESRDTVEEKLSVIILASNLYAKQLSPLISPGVMLVTERTHTLCKIPDIVRRQCSQDIRSRNAMWLLPLGMYSLVSFQSHTTCELVGCTNPLLRITVGHSDYIKKVAEVKAYARKLRQAVQEQLGSQGQALLVPLIPAMVAHEDKKCHAGLHEVFTQEGIYPITKENEGILNRFYSDLSSCWSQVIADSKDSDLLSLMNSYVMNQQRSISAITKETEATTVMQPWLEMIKEISSTVIKHSKNQVLPSELCRSQGEDEVEVPAFKNIVVLGNSDAIQNLKELQEKNSFIQFIHEKISFDEDGVKTVLKLQKTWPEHTLWIILSNFYQVMAVSENSAECKKYTCKYPVKVYSLKDESMKDCQGMNCMLKSPVDEAVNRAKEFVGQLQEHLGEDSAVFLAPLSPVVAVMEKSGSVTPHSDLHRVTKANQSLGLITGDIRYWKHCSSILYKKWEDMIVGTLEGCVPLDSIVDNYYSSCPENFTVIAAESPNTRCLSDAQTLWINTIKDTMMIFPHNGQEDIKSANDAKIQSPSKAAVPSPKDTTKPLSKRSDSLTDKSTHFRKHCDPPVKKRSHSPVRKLSYRYSPDRKRSDPPAKKREYSPDRKRSNSPTKKRAYSPDRKRSNSPTKKHAYSPDRKRSNSPTKKRACRYSPVIKRRNSSAKRRAYSPISKRRDSPARKLASSPTLHNPDPPPDIQSANAARNQKPLTGQLVGSEMQQSTLSIIPASSGPPKDPLTAQGMTVHSTSSPDNKKALIAQEPEAVSGRSDCKGVEVLKRMVPDDNKGDTHGPLTLASPSASSSSADLSPAQKLGVTSRQNGSEGRRVAKRKNIMDKDNARDSSGMDSQEGDSRRKCSRKGSVPRAGTSWEESEDEEQEYVREGPLEVQGERKCHQQASQSPLTPPRRSAEARRPRQHSSSPSSCASEAPRTDSSSKDPSSSLLEGRWDEFDSETKCKYEAAVKDLTQEHRVERLTYLEVPEAHPFHDHHYALFLAKYRKVFTDKIDFSHLRTLWKAFWRKVVSRELEKEWEKQKRQLEKQLVEAAILNKERTRVGGGLKTQISGENCTIENAPWSQLMARSLSGVSEQGSQKQGVSPVEKCSFIEKQIMEQFETSSKKDQSIDSTKEGVSKMAPHTSERSQASTSQNTNDLSQDFDQPGESSIAGTLTTLVDLCKPLGLLGPALRLVLHKIQSVGTNDSEIQSILTDKDNRLLLTMASEKLKILSEKAEGEEKNRLLRGSEASGHLLDCMTERGLPNYRVYHGVDVERIAKATRTQDASTIVQFIQHTLAYEGFSHTSVEDLNEIFLAVVSLHVKMTLED